MDKIDTRKQSTEVQQNNRDQAIRLHLDGFSRKDIARIIGIHPSTLVVGLRFTTKAVARLSSLANAAAEKGKEEHSRNLRRIS